MKTKAPEKPKTTKAPTATKSAPVAQVTPNVATTPPPAPKQARTGDCSMVNNYNWDKRIAYAVCMAESGGNSAAINWSDRHNGCTGSAGLMQIACIHTGGAHELDPSRNVQKAWEIYLREGWRPWSAFTSGAYLEYMP